MSKEKHPGYSCGSDCFTASPAQLDALGRGTASAPEPYTGLGGNPLLNFLDKRLAGQTTPPVPTIDRVVGRTRQEVEERIAGLLTARTTMIDYLRLKAYESDWHGAQNAGSYLRDIDAELVGLRWVLGS